MEAESIKALFVVAFAVSIAISFVLHKLKLKQSIVSKGNTLVNLSIIALYSVTMATTTNFVEQMLFTILMIISAYQILKRVK